MPTDWTQLVRQYKGLWVGLKDDEETVVASGQTVQEVLTEAKKEGFEHPILFRVPVEVVPYVGQVYEL